MAWEGYFYELDCTEVEGFLSCISGYEGLWRDQIYAMWNVYAEEGPSSFLTDLSISLKVGNPKKRPTTEEARFVAHIIFFKPDQLKSDQWQVVYTKMTEGVPYCDLMTLQEAYLLTNDMEKDEEGWLSSIMGWLGDRIDAVKTYFKYNLAIGIIVILIALTAIFYPAALATIGDTIWSVLKALGLATSKVMATVSGWITWIKTALHIQTIGSIMKTVGGISRLLEVISPTWRANIQEWTNEVAKASKALFGDSATIAAYLTAVQMAVWDVSRLAGQSYDMFQIEWYGKATEITTDIARKQKEYENNPGALWYDIQEWYLAPIYGDGEARERTSAELIASVALLADSLENTLSSVEGRLQEYQEVLTPTELAGLKRTVANVRIRLVRDAIEPLSDFKKDVTDIYIGKLPDMSFSERWKELVQPALDNATILGADEVTLTEYQLEQRLQKGENLMEFISRVSRGAWDGIVGGVHKLYAETIGKLARGEKLTIPELKYFPPDWEMIPSRLSSVQMPKRSPHPPPVPIPPVSRREAGLAELDTEIQSIKELL